MVGPIRARVPFSSITYQQVLAASGAPRVDSAGAFWDPKGVAGSVGPTGCSGAGTWCPRSWRLYRHPGPLAVQDCDRPVGQERGRSNVRERRN
jgi:hypothetical protein